MSHAFALTEKELKAATILVQSCLSNMGGSRPSDLDADPFTWVEIKDLMEEGYSQNEAAGLFSSLSSKGFIGGEYNTKSCDTFVTTEAYRFMDTMWEGGAV